MILSNSLLIKAVTILFIVVQCSYSWSQFSPDSLTHIEIQGNDTDPFIILDGAKKHQVFYNSTSQIKNTLLLHLVGSLDNPNSTILYPSDAANNGFHCINLAYRNLVSGQSACGDVPDTNCHLYYRKEIIEGVDYSSEINVNPANSINNRLIKLLQYLDVNYPTQNWSQYYNGNAINWEKLIVSGHSQGGGHAAVIGMTLPIQRVLMFGSPNDYSDTLDILAPWTALPHLVADSNYYSFNALYDEVIDFWKQFAHSDALNLDSYGDTVNVDQVISPYGNTRQLYTVEIVTSPNPLELTHDVMIRDAETPVDAQGVPLFLCVWRYMLGVPCGVSSISENHSEKELIRVYPNPAQQSISVTLNSSVGSGQQEVIIIDVLGRQQSSGEIINGAASFDLTNFPKGIYFVQLSENNKLIGSSRFIKQ